MYVFIWRQTKKTPQQCGDMKYSNKSVRLSNALI